MQRYKTDVQLKATERLPWLTFRSIEHILEFPSGSHLEKDHISEFPKTGMQWKSTAIKQIWDTIAIYETFYFDLFVILLCTLCTHLQSCVPIEL